MAMKFKKGVTLLAAVGVVGTMLLAGCSDNSSNDGQNEKITLTFETSVYAEAPHKGAIDTLIKRYNELNPNVEIKVHGTDYENFWDKLTTEIIAGTQGDIVQMYPENINTYHALQGGTFLNLDDRIKGTKLETGFVGQELAKVDGSYHAVSNYAWGTTGIFYRKSLFKEAGIDPASIKTLEDFKAAAIKLGVDKNGDGVLDQYGFSSVVGSHPFVASEWYRLVARPVSGGIFFGNGEAGPYTADRINVNSPANVWAATWWQDLINNKNVTPPGTRDKKVSREMFWNGQAAMMMDGPWFIGMSQEMDKALFDDIGLLPQPSIEYQGKTYKPNPHNNPIVALISKKTKHPDEAWAFLEWMTTDEAQAIISTSGMIPSSKAYAGTKEYSTANPMAAQFFDFQENIYAPAVMDPPIPELGTISQVLINATQDMFIGKQDVQKTMDAAAKEMKEAFK
jgi:ABC-type glycerol-3-phosphate transport system substrate-binding protein